MYIPQSLFQCSNLMLVEVIDKEPLSFHVIPFDNPRAQYTLQVSLCVNDCVSIE